MVGLFLPRLKIKRRALNIVAWKGSAQLATWSSIERISATASGWQPSKLCPKNSSKCKIWIKSGSGLLDKGVIGSHARDVGTMDSVHLERRWKLRSSLTNPASADLGKSVCSRSSRLSFELALSEVWHATQVLRTGRKWSAEERKNNPIFHENLRLRRGFAHSILEG